MLRVVGFTFSVTGLHYVVLEGSKNAPNFVTKNKIPLPPNLSVAELTEWYQIQIDLILNAQQPDAVNYKLNIRNVTFDMVQKVYYGQGILNLICKRRNISVEYISGNSLTANKFGLAKGANLYTFIDTKIGTHPPHWDKTMKETALIALTILP